MIYHAVLYLETRRTVLGLAT